MQVYAEDVRKLLEAAIKKHERRSRSKMSDLPITKYMDRFVRDVNRETRSSLVRSTLYKGYYIKLKTHDEKEIGFHIDYLNALSRYAFGSDYLDRFGRIGEGSEQMPDYPWDAPKFPATPVIPIRGTGYTDLWIKDEGFGPFGMMSDRKAHVIYKFYQKLFTEQVNSGHSVRLPVPSIMSSGYTALAIQRRLRLAGFPDLRVVLDSHTPPVLLTTLRSAGAVVTEVNLVKHRKKGINSSWIKNITKNPDGIDLTFGPELDDLRNTYYEGLAYEILAQNPRVFICSWGSGELMTTVLRVLGRELRSKRPSKWFFGNKQALEQCRFIAVHSGPMDNGTVVDALHDVYDLQPKGAFERLVVENGAARTSKLDLVMENKRALAKAKEITNEHHIEASETSLRPLVYFLENMRDFQRTERIIILNAGHRSNIHR